MDQKDLQRSNESRRDDLSIASAAVGYISPSGATCSQVRSTEVAPTELQGNLNMPLLYRQVIPTGLASAPVIHLGPSESF